MGRAKESWRRAGESTLEVTNVIFILTSLALVVAPLYFKLDPIPAGLANVALSVSAGIVGYRVSIALSGDADSIRMQERARLALRSLGDTEKCVLQMRRKIEVRIKDAKRTRGPQNRDVVVFEQMLDFAIRLEQDVQSAQKNWEDLLPKRDQEQIERLVRDADMNAKAVFELAQGLGLPVPPSDANKQRR